MNSFASRNINVPPYLCSLLLARKAERLSWPETQLNWRTDSFDDALFKVSELFVNGTSTDKAVSVPFICYERTRNSQSMAKRMHGNMKSKVSTKVDKTKTDKCNEKL